MNKKPFFFSILIRTIWYYSYMTKVMKFETSHKRDFLVFDVSNVSNIWHLDALTHTHTYIYIYIYMYVFYKKKKIIYVHK